MGRIDKITRKWVRDESDELAAAGGCRFLEERGQFAVDWAEDYLTLYEGVWAGRPFQLTGHWTYEAWMRLFGWVRPNVAWRAELPDEKWVRRFRSGLFLVPKKNMKSPNLAALILYMLIGDLRPGENGQKCFPAAKNGSQIRSNVARHVHEMVKRSAALSRACRINKSTAAVTHESSSSVMMPLCSDNVRSQQALEGLNGSTFVDEMHVVDESMIEVISRAGLSRPEPLHLEVSTAGADPDSYGYRRAEWSRQVSQGVVKDDTHLSIIYEAPADITDEELFANPVKYGRMANPAWGHTIKEEQFLSDLAESKTSPRKLAKFKQYRLNIWQRSETPWLDIPKWEAGAREELELENGEPTYGGLDLSSKIDFSAFRLVQRIDEKWVTDGLAWIAEARAQEHINRGLDLEQWQKRGWLRIIPGERIDYETVTADIAEFCAGLELAAVGYDAWQAEAARQTLEALGLPMVEVTQNYKNLSDPAKELEAAVKSGELLHTGDECLAWQARCATVVSDMRDNIKPVKPDRNKTSKAIDSIVALVMALGQALADADGGPSIYEQPGSLAL